MPLPQAREAKDRQRRAEHLGAAAKSLNAAHLLDPSEQLVALGKGMLHIAKVCVCVIHAVPIRWVRSL